MQKKTPDKKCAKIFLVRKFVLLFFILIQNACFCEETPPYTILKTTHDYTPIRENADTNAKRYTHLKKGARLYSDMDIKDFYRVDLGLDKYYWVEKKYADPYATAPSKEFAKIENIEFIEEENFYIAKITVPDSPPYNEIETSKNSLDFVIYDTFIEKNTEEENSNFKISKDKFGNLKISYFSNYPLNGHEVLSIENGLVLKIKKPFKISSKKPLKKLIFAIDPGHGGADFGACAFSLKEKDINLQISKKLETELKKQGAVVYLTRKNDVDVDLYERIDFAKEKEADFLISIHQNSLANRNDVEKKHGSGVYYYNKEAYPLAKAVQKSLVEGTKFKDDGVNLASFALTRSSNPVCILIECGYIIHKSEAQKISDSSFQKIISKSIAKGIKEYLKAYR